MFDFAADAARSALKLLGGAEHEVEQHSPVQEPLHEAISALHRAADSLDKHVEVLEAVAATLPALTGALVKLTEQLGEALHLAAPLEAAEREVAGIGHLFRRRHASPAAPSPAPSQDAAAPAAVPPGASAASPDGGAAPDAVAATVAPPAGV